MSLPIGIARRVYNGCQKRLARALLPTILRPSAPGLQLETLGDDDGAWTIPVNRLHPGAVCYCVGVGVNATFDVALAERGYRVWSFDPTPRAIEYVKGLPYDGDGLTFVPWGVWNQDTQLRFYAPMNRQHVNHSVVDIHGTGDYFTAECKTLPTIMQALGHDRIDLLKVDIEGAWYTVLEDLVRRRIGVQVLCAEFDTPTSLAKAMRMVRMLKKVGLSLVRIERENLLFVRQDGTPIPAGRDA